MLNDIEKQTNYLFVYDKKNVDTNRPISINASNQTVASVLQQLFAGTGVTYEMEGNNIVLTRQSATNASTQQSKRVKGTVLDKNGELIIGANVVVKGTTNGTITDIDGNFSLEALGNAQLAISYIGYEAQEVAVNNRSQLSITLGEDSQALDEVVVIGYGTARKGDLTGPISSIKGASLTERSTQMLSTAMQGQISGVEVTRLSGSPGAPTAYPVMRYGDVLLMYAEAMNEQSQCSQEVLDATINQLRARAYNGTGLTYPRVLADSQQKLRTILRTERFIELAWEGHRYNDLIRWCIAGKVYNRPVYFLKRAWSGSTSWEGDESQVSAEYKQLIQNWKDGNYPFGGVPHIDEDGIADMQPMVDAGYIVVATERKFNEDRDYLWPIPASDRLINESLTQNPNW